MIVYPFLCTKILLCIHSPFFFLQKYFFVYIVCFLFITVPPFPLLFSLLKYFFVSKNSFLYIFSFFVYIISIFVYNLVLNFLTHNLFFLSYVYFFVYISVFAHATSPFFSPNFVFSTLFVSKR